MRTTYIVWTIWCCFLARALFYCSAIPLWEGFDEYAHFALIRHVATHAGRFPFGPVPPDVSGAVIETRKLAPAAWVTRDARRGILSYEEYFSLPVAEQKARRYRLDTIPTDLPQNTSDQTEPLYEAQQPPLYYWLMAPFYTLVEHLSLPTVVWIIRSLTALIASAVVPLAFIAGRMAFRDYAMGLGVALVVASFPELYVMVSHISNDGLSIAIGAVLVLLALRMLERPPSATSGLYLGITVGAALLTKAYFLALVPAAAFVLFYSWSSNPKLRPQAVWQALAALGSSLAISAWWYVRNLAVTGTFTGQFEDVQAAASAHTTLLQAVAGMHWIRLFDLMAMTHIWLGGWSFLVTRSWMYRVVEFIAVAAVVGVIIQMIRRRSELPGRKELSVLALPYVAMTAGLCFHAAQVYRIRGMAATTGYYLYALVAAESMLLIAGIARLLPRGMGSMSVGILASVLILLEQFGAWFIMFPYYAGLIRHDASGRLPIAHIQQLWSSNGDSFFLRLSRIAPFSSPPTIAALAVLYIIATLTLLGLALHICIAARKSTSTPAVPILR